MFKFIKKSTLAAIVLALAVSPAKAADSCVPAQTASAQPAYDDPFMTIAANVARMNMEMNRLMEAAFSQPAAGSSFYSVDMVTTPGQYKITVKEPGLDDKNTKIDIDHDRTLTIQNGAIQKASTGKTDASSGLSQIMTLPQDADTAHIRTDYKNGVLTVIIPRTTAHTPAPTDKPALNEKEL